NVPLFVQNKDKDEEHDVSAAQRCGNIGLFFLWGGGTVSDISCAVSCQHGVLLVMETCPLPNLSLTTGAVSATFLWGGEGIHTLTKFAAIGCLKKLGISIVRYA